MAKINITKPTGMIESLNVISAFKAENNTYVVLDSEKMGSMGLPIIYVSKYTSKLEKINDANEWQSVKNYLKGIISGTNFEYIKLPDNINADEAFYTPLTLPSASFDAIKSRYVIPEDTKSNEGTVAVTTEVNQVASAPVMPSVNTPSNQNINVSPVAPAPVIPKEPEQTNTMMNLIDQAYTMPNVASTPTPVVEQPTPNVPQNSVESVATSVNITQPTIQEPKINSTMNFEDDKETFLKACENMFDALVAKYQKELNRLEEKEQELARKEQEINIKMNNANEHLRNAEAREQVANIVHDNAQKVMDLNNFMPVNPNNNPGN